MLAIGFSSLVVPTDFEESSLRGGERKPGRTGLRENEGTGIGCSSYKKLFQGVWLQRGAIEWWGVVVAGREVG